MRRQGSGGRCRKIGSGGKWNPIPGGSGCGLSAWTNRMGFAIVRVTPINAAAKIGIIFSSMDFRPSRFPIGDSFRLTVVMRQIVSGLISRR